MVQDVAGAGERSFAAGPLTDLAGEQQQEREPRN